PPTRGRPLTRPCARGAASHLGLAPSESSSAESRRLGRIPGNGCALVRKPLIEGAWVLARGNPACRKRGGTPVPLAIREHARACSGRLLGRRRELVSRGPVLREANTATAAEMARMLLHVGRDVQEAAALEEARCGPHELRYPRTWDCAPARRSRSGLPGRRCGSAIEG
ncbi:MAG: transposase, partial [Olsenella sp.]